MHKNQMLEKTILSINPLVDMSLVKSITMRHLTPNKQKSCKGIMVAFRIGDDIFLGQSMCGHGDKFNKELGYKVAVERAIKSYSRPNINIAESAMSDFANFCGKAYRYFRYEDQNAKFPMWYEIMLEEAPTLRDLFASKAVCL